MIKKVFLYLYPVEEYIMSSLLIKKETEKEEALKTLNECIQKRYRDKNYEVVFALYPDKKMYGIVPKEGDKIIYTDVSFEEATSIDKNGNKKLNFEPKYPNEEFLIKQLGKVDKLVMGGFHEDDCVRRVGECALNNGIYTYIDLDMTDSFFYLYKDKDYFIIDKYNPVRYKVNALFDICGRNLELAEKIFDRIHASDVYGFNETINKRTNEIINEIINEITNKATNKVKEDDFER